MFQRKKLEQLRREKEQLVSQGDAHRLQLMSDWQRFQSPELWLDETLGLTRRHPLWLAGLATVAGALAVKILREPRTLMAGISRLGQLASVAVPIWRWFRRKKWRP